MATPEGYATPEENSYRYVYQYKDHLDNVRLSYTKNDAGSLEIIEENNYYPFGLKHKGYNSSVSSLGNSTAQLLKFGGKELQDEIGLGWIDITARNYDPALGRWMNLDPLAEEMRRHSPYNYGFDNPIYFIDPDGMKPTGPGNPIIKRAVRALIKKTLKNHKTTLLKSRKSYVKLIKEHKQKLADFKKDPVGNSSKEALSKMTKDNPSEEVLKKRAMGRAGALEKQITKQEGELAKLDGAIARINENLDNISKAGVGATAASMETTNADDCNDSCADGNSNSSSESTDEDDAGTSFLEFALPIVDFSENIFTDTFGDDSMGLNKGLDESNPFDFGIGDLIRRAIEASKSNEDNN